MLIKQVIKQTIKWYCVCNKILNSGGQRTVGVGQLAGHRTADSGGRTADSGGRTARARLWRANGAISACRRLFRRFRGVGASGVAGRAENA